MSKSTPKKRTARATGATPRTGTRKRSAARSPAAKTAARKEAASKKSLVAAGEPKVARQPPEPNEQTLTLDDYSAQVQAAVRAASAKKAEKIMVLDLRHTSAFTDVFVLCTGQNARQVKAIVDSVEEALKALGQRAVAVEGYRGSEWVLVDYFDFVVHVFTPESREFYALERLWGSAIRVEVADEPAAAVGEAAARPDPDPAAPSDPDPAAARRWLDAALTLLFAPPCATCDRPLARPSASAVCDACWSAVARWSPPWCACCGEPRSPWRQEADVCPRCRRIAGALPVRVVGPYEGRLRDVLHTFKYDGRRSLAPTLAGLMTAQAADVLGAADVLVPVPLHRARRRARGFNQAHDLAAALGPPVIAALQRVRATTAQTALTASARRRNVRGAFALAPAGYGRGRWSTAARQRATIDAIAGRVVVLVDDVITTGATLDACAAVLRAAGAAEVRAVTVARAVIGRRR